MSKHEYVYATAFNIKRTILASNINESKVANALIKDAILNRTLNLSKSDLTAFRTLYLFLEDPERFIKEYFIGWKDTYTYLIEKPPAYHADPTCKFFLKDFFNIEIPQKIKNKGLVEEARTWAYNNRSNLNRNSIERFKTEFIEHFNRKYDVKLEVSDLDKMERPNSGKELVNSDLEEIRENIAKLLSQFQNGFTDAKRNFFLREFRDHQFKYNNQYKKEEPAIEVRIIHELWWIKKYFYQPLKKNLADYIFLSLGQDHKYKTSVLEYLNFEPCHACSKQH